MYLSLGQVAERYSVSGRTIKRGWSQGTFPAPIKIGGSYRWSLESLEQFEQQSRATTDVSAAPTETVTQ